MIHICTGTTTQTHACGSLLNSAEEYSGLRVIHVYGQGFSLSLSLRSDCPSSPNTSIRASSHRRCPRRLPSKSLPTLCCVTPHHQSYRPRVHRNDQFPLLRSRELSKSCSHTVSECSNSGLEQRHHDSADAFQFRVRYSARWTSGQKCSLPQRQSLSAK